MKTTFEEILARDGRLVYRIKGVSMLPMLRQGRDIVVIDAPSAPLKRYDVALYRRGKDYVLHRVIEVRDGRYLIRGDNTYTLEDVRESDVIGVLTQFNRGGKLHAVTERGYGLYVRFWCAVYPARAGLFHLRRWAVRCARKLGLLPLLKKWLRRPSNEERSA